MRSQGGHREMMAAALAGARAEEAAARRLSAEAERMWRATDHDADREAFRAAHRRWTEAVSELVEIEAELAESGPIAA